jgi:hypothetical protein
MRKVTVRYEGLKPKCFDSNEQYKQWIDLARQSGPIPSQVKACIDCNPKFQAEMNSVQRCENPFVQFKYFTVKINKNQTAQELRGWIPKGCGPC